MRVKIGLHDGTVHYVDVVEFDAQDIANKINDQSNLVVVIGDVIAHRTSIKEVVANPVVGEE